MSEEWSSERFDSAESGRDWEGNVTVSVDDLV